MKFLNNHICHVVLGFIRHAVLNVFEQSERWTVYKVDRGFEYTYCRLKNWAICRFDDEVNRSARERSGKVLERVCMKTAQHGLPLIDLL